MKTPSNYRTPRKGNPCPSVTVLMLTAIASAVTVHGQSASQTPSTAQSADPVLDNIQDVKPRNRNISITGDYLTGFGNITLPVGFALDTIPGERSVQSPERDSTYYGGSISWQAFPSVGFDISYSQGTSTGIFGFEPDNRWPGQAIASKFTLEDTWLQGYVRYRINRFSGTRFNAYLRGGVTYVDAEYTGESVDFNGELYKTLGTSKDYTGNLGFGLDYRLFNIKEVRVRSVFEGEGFGGIRSRAFSEETLSVSGSNSLDNLIYGALGRLLLRMDYNFGKESEWKLFLEGGVQSRWTMEAYGQLDRPLDIGGGKVLSEIDESGKSDILWGPYVRAGIRYSF